MKLWSLLWVGLGGASVAALMALTLLFAGPAEASTYYVDFDKGRDQADGLTPATAWQHSPGDPKASGGPARTRLRPGDTIVFAANVRYRGTIIVRDSGSVGNPITFRSAMPREAVMDGSDPVNARRCRSDVDCGGASNWRSLVRIDLPGAVDDSFALFGDARPLRPAQEPDPSDDFYRNEIDDLLKVDGQAMSRGEVTLPDNLAAALKQGGGRLALWVKPNRVVHRPITGINGVRASFDPSGLQFYTDRPAKAGAVDHVSLIDQPGEYAKLPEGNAVVAMAPTGESVSFSVGSGRGGFQIQGASHIVVRDLRFENMSDGGGLPPAGVAVFTPKSGASDITIHNNVFRNFVMPRGQGPIIQREVRGLRITENLFDSIVLGSGMRLTGSDIQIVGNEIRRLGRTGIMLIGTSDVLVQRNRISDIRGVHGNGLSVYLDNRNVRIIGNTITDAKQPATFHGDRGKGNADNNILFANNLFVATSDALGALISWGASTRGVTIRNNVLLGGRTGLRLHAADSKVTIADNVASGLIISKGPPSDWLMVGNAWSQLTFQQRRETPQPKVSDWTKSLERELKGGAVSKDLCDHIKRRSHEGGAGDHPTAPTVGAQLSCS